MSDLIPTGTVVSVQSSDGPALAVIRYRRQEATETGVEAGYCVIFGGREWLVKSASSILDHKPACPTCGDRAWWWCPDELLLPKAIHCGQCAPPPRPWWSAMLRVFHSWRPAARVGDADLAMIRDAAFRAFEDGDLERFQQLTFGFECAKRHPDANVQINWENTTPSPRTPSGSA